MNLRNQRGVFNVDYTVRKSRTNLPKSLVGCVTKVACGNIAVITVIQYERVFQRN
jgi:hypothetical protein